MIKIPFLNEVLQGIGKILSPLVEAAKWFTSIFYARKSAKKEVINKSLEQANETQKEQLEIAARPKRSIRSILDSMRRGKR